MPDDQLGKIIDQRNQIISHAQKNNPGMKAIWQDEDWKLIRIKKKVFNIKLGKMIFDYQDMTIGKKPMHSSLPKIDGNPWMQAYSPRIGRNFHIRQTDIEFIEDDHA